MARRRRRQFVSKARAQLAWIPVAPVVVVDDSPVDVPTELITGSTFLGASVFDSTLTIRRIIMKIVISGVCSAGVQAVRIICGLLLQRSGEAAMNLRTFAAQADQQADLMYIDQLMVNVTTDEVAEGVAQAHFDWDVKSQRKMRANDRLILQATACTIAGAAVAAGTSVTLGCTGRILVSR